MSFVCVKTCGATVVLVCVIGAAFVGTGRFVLFMTKTENGPGGLICRAEGWDDVCGLVLGCDPFSFNQMKVSAATPMRIAMTKNLLPGLFCFGADANCFRHGTAEFKYKNWF